MKGHPKLATGKILDTGGEQTLDKAVRDILEGYGKYALPGQKLCSYDLDVNGSQVVLSNIGGNKARVVKEDVSAWVLLAGKYWATTYSDESHELSSQGYIPSIFKDGKPHFTCLDAPSNYRDMWNDKEIARGVAEVGRYLFSHGEKEEAEQCFYAALEMTKAPTIDEMVALVPDSSWQKKLKQMWDRPLVKEEIWAGRKSMSVLTGTKSMAPFCQDAYPLHRYQALDFFQSALQLSGGEKVATAKHIHDVFLKAIFPLVSDPAGIVRQKALACTEHWILTLMEEQAGEDVYFYRESLPCLGALLERGIGNNRHSLYRWECQVGLGDYERAAQEWDGIARIAGARSAGKILVSTFGDGDIPDWQIAALTRAAKANFLSKKLTPSQLSYADSLLKEAIVRAEPRLEKDLKESRREHDDYSRVFFANTYEMLGVLREKQNRCADALTAYERAKAIQLKLGPPWLDKKYDEMIERVKTQS